jgi:hypothetical protein
MTSGAHDDEDRWLEARERGETGPPIPAKTAAKYSELQSLLEDLPAMPADVRPRPGWQQSVLDAIDRSDAGRSPEQGTAPRSIHTAPRKQRSTKQRVVFAASCVAAAAGVAIVIKTLTPKPGVDSDLSIAALSTADPTLMGPELLAAGRKALVRGVIDGPGELRAYGADDVELARCTVTGPSCTVDRSGKGTTLRMELVLPAPGRLHLVLLSAPLAGASRGRADDLAAAARAGITTRSLDKIVR